MAKDAVQFAVEPGDRMVSGSLQDRPHHDDAKHPLLEFGCSPHGDGARECILEKEDEAKTQDRNMAQDGSVVYIQAPKGPNNSTNNVERDKNMPAARGGATLNAEKPTPGGGSTPFNESHDPWRSYKVIAEADPVTSWEILRQVSGSDESPGML